MKLSFSTSGWHALDWDDFFGNAKELGFDGIEIRNIDSPRFSGLGGPLAPANTVSTLGRLDYYGLCVPCLDADCNIADVTNTDDNVQKILRYIDTARRIRTSFIRLYANELPGGDEDAAVCTFLQRVLPAAQAAGVTLLIETTGVYADTKRLCGVLDTFACDGLAALWDMQHPYRLFGESPQETVENLGAYICHVHIKDSQLIGDTVKHCLMGEGDMPIDELMTALRSLNYEGFVSFEWHPSWLPELADLGAVGSQFVSFMSRYREGGREKARLYSNRAGTGSFIFPKDELIDLTFPQLLARVTQEFPDQYAFKYTTLDYTRTYAQFSEDVDEFARVLVSLGVRAGSNVAVWMTNLPQWYIAFWAVTKIGAVLVTMNTAYKIREAEYLLRQSDAHTLIMEKGFRSSDYVGIINELCPELAEAQAGKPLHLRGLPFLRNIITVGCRNPGCLTWEEALERAPRVPVEEVYRRAALVRKHDVCNMQYTSGTTGFPKGVMLTHYNIVNNGKCIGDRMDLSTADRMMIQVPMFHCFGMVLAMTASMTHGATLLPLPYFAARPALACIHQEKITAFHGVPTMFIAMLEHEDFPKTDFSHMRTGIMAGSPCPIAVMRDVVEKMQMREITIVYGQTEASPGCTMSSTDDPLDVRVETVGRPLPQIECRIVDPETGEELPDGEIGEFVARGYNLMKGYYKMPRATLSAIDAQGWLHTGDLACRTPEGNFRITGRLKDMIIRGGENVYPKEIEDFIYTHPKVSDVQVIGVPDKKMGEEIMACVVLKENESMTADELRKYVRSHMAYHKVPRYVDFMKAFPTNAAGKILKYKMREDAVKKLEEL